METPVMQLTPDDYVAIYQLYAEYALATDTGNGPARAATFTPDGTVSSYLSNHEPQGVDVIRERTNSYPQKRIPDARMMHIQAGIHLTPTADGANGSCYAVLVNEDASGKRTLSQGYYTDTLVKTAEGWRFKSREVFVSGQDY